MAYPPFCLGRYHQNGGFSIAMLSDQNACEIPSGRVRLHAVNGDVDFFLSVKIFSVTYEELQK